MVLAHAAAHDDEVRPEQVLDDREVPLQPLGPRGPVEPFAVACAVGGSRLGVVPVDLQVTELGVGDEVPVDDQRGPDAGARA